MRYQDSYTKGETQIHRIKVLFAILSIDIHNRAALVLCQELRDAGMEVVYLGFGLTPKMVASIAEQEDPDVICLSTHQGFHTQLYPRLVRELKIRGLSIPLVAGGSIQDKDKPALERMGITGNFGPGTPISTIIEHIRAVVPDMNKVKLTGENHVH